MANLADQFGINVGSQRPSYQVIHGATREATPYAERPGDRIAREKRLGDRVAEAGRIGDNVECTRGDVAAGVCAPGERALDAEVRRKLVVAQERANCLLGNADPAANNKAPAFCPPAP